MVPDLQIFRSPAGVLCLLLSAAAAAAQDAGSPAAAGPPPPVPPATVTRDEHGRATVRAVRLTRPLRLDGRLDEEVYTSVPPIDGFIQQLPVEGVPASEPTDVWILFDEDTLYIAARCHDSQPDRIVANELRRDNTNIFFVNDNFSVAIDTFYDQRNALFFQTNPIGAIRDQAVAEGTFNVNWNTVWDARTARVDAGYTLEMAIPFKSLRYRAPGPQIWGINFRRQVKSKNETSMLTRVPQSYGGNGVAQMAVAATLIGLEIPAQSLNLEFKPYAVSSLTTDRAARVPFDNDLNASAGIDVKYGVTRSLTADLTVNTDFAQVEEDQQQINLTRFNLFFPEKRDFFLEGQGIFDFGGVSGQRASGVNPILFFSRRIGLSGGQAVPVLAGGRMTGKAGRFDVGALAIATDDKPSAGAVKTTFSALRLRRNVLRRSSVGMIATGRWPAASGRDENTAAGVDADLRFFENVQANLYWARTASPARRGDDTSYRTRFSYAGDRYGFEADRLLVQSNFNPEVGFVRRTDFALNSMMARFSPRLRRGRAVRMLTWQGDLEYLTDAAGDVLEDRSVTGRFGVEFDSSDEVTLLLTRQYERLPVAFTIAPGVVVPAGGYSHEAAQLTYRLGQQRTISGDLSVSHGSFYEGTRTAAGYSGRLGLSPHFTMEPVVTLNWIALPYGEFTAHLGGARVSVTPTARLGFSALSQFNPGAHSLTSSVRMRWEYVPGSELFIVYSDGRDTDARGFPGLQNRSVAVKMTRLLRF
ncbi:MAG: carbohydrate binding family 9 domain-containing protein [Acidobacteria bacterium]|nr:carbohydrate binding family 9 domain-containing protein [Acidobacteriota bacterium]